MSTLLFLLLASQLPRAYAEGLHWEDWDRLQVCSPLDFSIPPNEAEVVKIVKEAAAAGDSLKQVYSARSDQITTHQTLTAAPICPECGSLTPPCAPEKCLRVVGAGHSFTPIALTTGRMISLDAMGAVLSVDAETHHVVVQGGIRLRDLNHELELRGLSIPNMGATCEQSVAGATATGTHGTGTALGSMSTQIAGLRLVAANGTVLEASAAVNPAVFAAARVGLGALGVVTEVTLAAEPLFYLRLNNTVMPLDELLDTRLAAAMASCDRVQWFWAPGDEEHATLVTREVVAAPASSGGGCWEGAFAGRHPGEDAALFGDDAATPQSTSCTDVSYKALCGSRSHYKARVLYTEMEMFVPIDEVGAAIAEFRKAFAGGGDAPPGAGQLFCGVRYVAADEITLSPQHGRANAVISFILRGPNTEATGDPAVFRHYAQQLEAIAMGAHAGRPHWGKMHWSNETELRPAYGDEAYDAFLAVRDALDPKRVFGNDFLRVHLDAMSTSKYG